MRFSFAYVLGLRAFLALDNFKFDVIAFLKALVAFGFDGAVVDENVRAVIATDEAKTLGVVKPFHFSFDSRHDPYSELFLKEKVGGRSPGTVRFSKLGTNPNLCRRRNQTLPLMRLLRNLAFGYFLSVYREKSNKLR